MKATQSGDLIIIPNCQIIIPNAEFPAGGRRPIKMTSLPEVTDTKTAVYNNEGIIGRSFPLYTYSHSADRQISMQIHFFVVKQNCGTLDCYQCAECNLASLRAIQSAVYPREGKNGTPYKPPAICVLKCGDLIAKGKWVCAALQSYSVKFPTDVAWDYHNTLCPYRFDVDTSWLIMYSSEDLPYSKHIVKLGTR